MSTTIRPEVSENNPYYISKHRYYELKHFCLQYNSWRRMHRRIMDELYPNPKLSGACLMHGQRTDVDPTLYSVEKLEYYYDRIMMVENAAREADEELFFYILKGVTDDLSYTNLKTVWNIPCCKDTYYDRRRKFFWLLSKARK